MLAAALFIPQLVTGLYEGLGRHLPDAFGWLGTARFFLSIAAWFWSYCRSHRLPWIMDMGWFLMAAWFIVIPYYVVKCEGRRGLLRVGLFGFTYFAAWTAGRALSIWVRLLFGPE